ncbi:MAG: hypothetical protein L6R40_000889 [Gallowayella cf. fulva]|nr:MAG: hypothetical protein L6R40_000889 [Xanthomendoza cf. fulva]
MEHTAIEDFQRFHGRHARTLSNGIPSRSSSIRPQDSLVRSVEHEDEDGASLSGSAHHSSGPDEALFDAPLSRCSSPHTSHHSDDDESLSSFISGSREASRPPEHVPSSPYSPLKMRSPFRNPSSVRAMQLDTTPPPYIPSSQSRQRATFPTPSRNGTPKSARSGHGGVRTSPSKMSPTKRANVKKEYPLVLLHVTLLPLPRLCSAEVMEQVLPSYLLENWKILREKATDTVLERGILIPHPREDYDLLEERLLESLDLKTPRILKCGHFHLDPQEVADAAGSDTEDEDEDDDADICDDCGRRVRDGRYGSGTGSRRWDIKVYAANGLMRAGAWGAAWREMERVDVEIVPWMDEELKRELAVRAEEERKHAALLQEEIVERGEQGPNMDEERLREIYGDDVPFVADPKGEQSPPSQPKQNTYPRQDQVPLQNLLKNYLMAAAQDPKNVAIFVLTIFVLYMSIAWRPSMPPASMVPQHSVLVPPSSSVTSTAAATPSSSTSASLPSSIEPIIQEASESSTVPEQAFAVTASPVSEPSSEDSMDSMDSIEARFEFAGE